MTAPNNVAAGCAAPDQSAPIPAGVDLEKETVITGIVRTADGEPVGGAYVRLLDSTGIDVEGLDAVVVGRSDLVGRPMAQMLRGVNKKQKEKVKSQS